jgi:hypothetical protein
LLICKWLFDKNKNIKSKNKFKKFAGIWQDRDIDINYLRSKAWKK